MSKIPQMAESVREGRARIALQFDQKVSRWRCALQVHLWLDCSFVRKHMHLTFESVLSPLNWLSNQRSHCRISGNTPARQSSREAAPADEKVPGGQSVQTDSFWAFVMVE